VTLMFDGQEGAPFKLSGPCQPFDVQPVSTFNMHVARSCPHMYFKISACRADCTPTGFSRGAAHWTVLMMQGVACRLARKTTG
jgi:hypothetical protein